MESFLTPYGSSNSGQEKLQFTPFWCGPRPVCSDGLRAGTIESHNFFVLGPILVKFHIRTRLIESFPTIFRTWWRSEENLHVTPVHTWRQLKRDEALSPPLGRVVEFRARYGEETARRFGGWAKFEERGTHGWEKIVLHTCSDLSRLVRTYVQYSDHVRSSCYVIFCTFERSYSSVLRPILVKLHILTRLIDSFPMVHGSWSCVEIEMLIPLGVHA